MPYFGRAQERANAPPAFIQNDPVGAPEGPLGCPAEPFDVRHVELFLGFYFGGLEVVEFFWSKFARERAASPDA